MDINLLNEILDQYEHRNTRWPHDLEINELQKAYADGYLAGMGQKDGAELTDQSIRKQINNVRSKYCEPILKLLAEEGSLYHGDLAEKLELSASGLNAIIKKMQDSEIPLIQTDQIGKYKIYSLPINILEYIRKKNIESINEEITTKCISTNMFLTLQRFVEKAGENWKETLNLLAQGNEENYSADIIAEFNVLIDVLIEVKDQKDELEKLQIFLKNEVLVYLLNQYISLKLQCETVVQNIIDIHKDSLETKLMKHAVQKMVDHI